MLLGSAYGIHGFVYFLLGFGHCSVVDRMEHFIRKINHAVHLEEDHAVHSAVHFSK